MSFSPNDAVRLVVTQTTYSIEEAVELLARFNGNPESVIRHYLNPMAAIKEDELKDISVSQLNQAMYKQFRRQLDISDFRAKNPDNIDEIAHAMQEENMKKNMNKNT